MKNRIICGLLTLVFAVTSVCSVSASNIDSQWFSVDTAAIEAQISEASFRMENAHIMAESARILGMDEACETIVLAKNIWHEAEAEVKLLVEELQSLQSKREPSYELFQATGLSVEAFNVMLSGSNLAGHGADFYELEQTYNINGVFAIAVAKTESGLGRSKLAINKNNYYGMLGCSFGSVHEGILAFGRLMNKPLYHGRALESIAETYCPPTSNEWAATVKACMNGYWSKLSDN